MVFWKKIEDFFKSHPFVALLIGIIATIIVAVIIYYLQKAQSGETQTQTQTVIVNNSPSISTPEFIHPDSPNYNYILSLEYYAQGDLAGAIENCKTAIEEHEKLERSPLDFDAAKMRNSLGMYYAELEEYTEAINCFAQAIAALKENEREKLNLSICYYNRGLAYDDKGEYDLAIADFTKATELDPKFAAAYNNRGIIYGNNKGEYDLAIADYTKAIELDPKYAAAYNNRGIIYGNDKGEYDLAIADFTKAIELNPKFAAAYYNRAIAYDKLGKTKLAEADRAAYKRLTGN